LNTRDFAPGEKRRKPRKARKEKKKIRENGGKKVKKREKNKKMEGKESMGGIDPGSAHVNRRFTNCLHPLLLLFPFFPPTEKRTNLGVRFRI
jgi:hypothetical protein